MKYIVTLSLIFSLSTSFAQNRLQPRDTIITCEIREINGVRDTLPLHTNKGRFITYFLIDSALNIPLGTNQNAQRNTIRIIRNKYREKFTANFSKPIIVVSIF